MLNKVLIIANLTKDPEIRYTGAGKAVCNLRIANNREYKPKDGEAKKETIFLTAVVWGTMAEICSKELHKGSEVFIEGHMTQRSWKPEPNGKEVSVTEIQVGTIQFIERVKAPVAEDSQQG